MRRATASLFVGRTQETSMTDQALTLPTPKAEGLLARIARWAGVKPKPRPRFAAFHVALPEDWPHHVGERPSDEVIAAYPESWAHAREHWDKFSPAGRAVIAQALTYFHESDKASKAE